MPISKLSACVQTIFCHAHAHASRAIHAVIWVSLLFPMCAPVNANTNSDTLQTFAGVIDRQEHTDEGRRRRGSGGMGQVTPEQEKISWWARVRGRDLVLGGLCHSSPEDSLLLFFHLLEMHSILVWSTQALAWKERTVCHYTTFLHYTTCYGSACEG